MCGKSLHPSYTSFLCPHCRLPLGVELTFHKNIDWEAIPGDLSVWRYRSLIPVPDEAEIVSLNEGGTPLIRSRRVGDDLGIKELFIKFEGLNPTGSFKDRGMTVGVTLARYLGFKGIMVASTGNTSASAAAYAARASMKCVVVLPKGKVARGKLSQAILHGATVIEVEGSFDDALKAVINASLESRELYPLNSFNPWRLEGQKTIAYEIYDQLGRVPDAVVVPVGNAGNISAIWKGFKELKEGGVVDTLPRMYGVQAEGAAPLAKAWSAGESMLTPVESPETIATAIRIGRPINWVKALKAVKESGGAMIAVSDNEILDAQSTLARLEGIGVEPASAAPLACLRELLKSREVGRDEVTVIIATGHALKDPETAASHESLIFSAKSPSEAVKIIRRLVS